MPDIFPNTVRYYDVVVSYHKAKFKFDQSVFVITVTVRLF